MRALLAPSLLTLAVLLTAPATASDLTRPERKALTTVERTLASLAKFAARGKDFDAAEEELRLGLAVSPDAKKLTRELERTRKLGAKNKRSPKDGFDAKLAERRDEAHAAVAMALVDAALAVEQEHPTRYQRYLELIQTRFPSQEALDALDLVYFEPYFRWVSGTEAELLSAGGELHEGEWLDADAVAALDRQHASWTHPWVISDEVHEVRTTLPLRKAKQILAYVAAYRTYFLDRFGSLWDLQTPTGKLPVIVTRTQAELREQMQAVGAGAMAQGGVQGAAFYMQTNGKLNPCFVTLEPTDATGRLFKIEQFEQLQIPLAHEVTHQLAFEYSKHDYDNRRQIQHQFWAVEAIANFMGYHSFDGKRWSLTHPRTIPMGSGMIEGPFAYCVNNRGRLPELGAFMAQSQAQFMTVENYHVAATLAYFLLEGEGGKYRASFVKLLEAVHKVKDRPDTWETAFPGVDLSTLQAEFLRFVGGIQLDA